MSKIPFRFVVENLSTLNVEDQMGEDAELMGGEIFLKIEGAKIVPTLTLDFLVEREYLLKHLPEMIASATSVS